MVKFENKLYRNIHSLQGDVVGILDTNGTRVVEYKYDAWGKPVSVDNGYVYCHNSPAVNADTSGMSSYYVVLNVYTPDDYENNAGHYDVSVISRERLVHYEYNGRTYSREEWTFSYGPFNDGQGYVKMYEGGQAKKHERFVVFDDLTQEEFQEFIDWLINDFSTFEEAVYVTDHVMSKLKETFPRL